MHLSFPIVFANLKRQAAFTHTVVKGANLQFVASLLVTLNSLILVWVIESFHSGVAFRAL